MGNRDEFDDLFGDDDEFNFDDDDNLGFDDDDGVQSRLDDDYNFDDDFGSIEDSSFDTDLLGDDEFDDLDDETFFEGEDENDGGGVSRTFVILAGIMIIFFLIGLGVVLFLVLGQDDTPSPIQLTSTAIVQLNATAMVQLEQTQTQSAENAIGTETQQALDIVATQTAEVLDVTATAEGIIVQTQAAEAEATAQAQALFDQQTADAAFLQTQEAELAIQETPDPDDPDEPEQPLVTQPPADVGDVALTATALFEFLQTPIATPGVGVGGGGDSPTPVPPITQLPDSGLFDDLSGGQNMGVIMLLAFGLIGLIFGARRLRSVNNRKD